MVPQGQQAQQQKLPTLDQLLKNIPFGFRLLTLILFAIWVMDLLASSAFLLNDQEKIFYSPYELWRLFTSSFTQQSLFYLTINIMTLNTILPKLEIRMSTSWLLLNYLFVGFVIQLVSTLLLSVVMSRDFFRLFMPGDSFGICFNYIFKYCYYNNTNKIKFCCFPFMIPKIAYPFVLFAVMTLLDIFIFKIRIDAIVGILIAFIQCKLIIPKTANFDCCARLYNLCDKLPLSAFDCWVKASSMMTWPEGPYANIQQENCVLKQDSDDMIDKNNPFAKKQGVRLSDA